MADESQTSVSTSDAPAADEGRFVEQELLVEDVSIDGMCRVYWKRW